MNIVYTIMGNEKGRRQGPLQGCGGVVGDTTITGSFTRRSNMKALGRSYYTGDRVLCRTWCWYRVKVRMSVSKVSC
jgi:hypothetical protein